MIRAALTFVVFVGFAASLLSNWQGPSAHRDPNQATIAVDNPSADGASLSQLDDGNGGDAVTLNREADGHFYADVLINGATIRMLVDTGATAIALSRDDARRASVGISIGMPNVVGQGASGEVKGEFVKLGRVSLGRETAEDVSAIVLDGGEKSLLGQTFLSKFASIEMHGDTMVLR